MISCLRTPSPVGTLTLLANRDALIAVHWEKAPPKRENAPNHPILRESVRQLSEYFEGTRLEFELPIAWTGTAFQESAWSALGTIPYGETITYGEQAARLGDRKKARAVGAANGKNPLAIIVPCHRVVGRSGSLTGFAGGLDAKKWLLDHERRINASLTRRAHPREAWLPSAR